MDAVGLTVCVLSLICLRACISLNNDVDDEEFNRIRRAMSERRRGATGDGETLTTSEERKKRVKERFFTRRLEKGDSSRSIRSLSSIIKASRAKFEENASSSSSNAISRSIRSATSSVRTFSKPECCICLDEYHEGDTICWAKTDKCDHIFHEECMLEWMSNHDECPLCRTNIMSSVIFPTVAGGTSGSDTPSGGTSGGGTSGGGTSGGGTSGGGTSGGGTSAGGTSAGGTSAGGTSAGGTAAAGTSAPGGTSAAAAAAAAGTTSTSAVHTSDDTGVDTPAGAASTDGPADTPTDTPADAVSVASS